MVDQPNSKLHLARLRLFQRAVRRGYVTMDEIDHALPSGTLSSSERWLLHYSLESLGVEIHFDGEVLAPVSESA